ncbi:MAG: NAD(P)H-hydrate dehydratase [Oscillospiraceae bacterium]|nr:NAD(P)H-hydrate dehydratase [Oscillospiraceae bacterium]
MYDMICTVDQMRRAEAIAAGSEDRNSKGFFGLMERAGEELASAVLSLTDEPDGKSVLILCGKGNNGGDGFTAARLLSSRMRVTAALMSDKAPTGIAAEEFTRMQSYDVRTVPWSDVRTSDYDVIVDAVFGTGFHGELPENVSLLFADVMNSGALKIAADIPSGIDADTGSAARCAFSADHTVTFGAVKLGMFQPKAKRLCGEIHTVAIGVEDALSSMPYVMRMMDEETALAALPARHELSHKGSFGKLLIAAGSRSMSGAAALSVRAALSGGAGLVRLATVDTVADRVGAGIYEATYAILDHNAAGEISATSLDRLEEELKICSAAAIGPGMGTSADISAVVGECIRICGRERIPLVIDADGLNVLAGRADMTASFGCRAVMMPHPKELSRLVGADPAEVTADRLRYAIELAEKSQAVVVSKGWPTYIISPDGRAYLSCTGNGGLSKGGSGDVLTGLTAGIIASNKGDRLFESACAAVYIFGAAADITAQRLSMTGMLPSDVIYDMNEIFRRKN